MLETLRGDARNGIAPQATKRDLLDRLSSSPITKSSEHETDGHNDPSIPSIGDAIPYSFCQRIVKRLKLVVDREVKCVWKKPRDA
jgi:hypothetical protein